MSTHQFKVGDRVEILNNKGFNSGTVVAVSSIYGSDSDPMMEVEVDGRSDRPHNFYTTNLRLITESQPHAFKFKAGDKALFQGQILGTKYNYTTPVEVTIANTVSDSDSTFVAEFPDLKARYYVSLKCLTPISHSPPQQTNQQTEGQDMKPYAVIYQSLSNQSESNIQSRHTTEAEAKEAAEVLVAAQRADLTTKKYFSISILNTKTGELVGSVTDAPPVVDWKAGK